MILMMFGLTLLAPLLLSWVVNDGAQDSYDEAFFITMSAGAALYFVFKNARRELQTRDGFLLVVMVWTVLPAFAAMPFILELGLSFTDAYFEAASGLTTTGASVLNQLDLLPMSINLWRHQLVWIGGMGLIVLAVAILPLLGIGGRQMFQAETPGPMKDERMTPRIAETAKGLYGVYVSVTLLCALCYWAAGMSLFDAVCHSFSTLGLGGFSTHDQSFGYFDSVLIETICVVFMLIAGMNFRTLYLAMRGQSIKPYFRDPEAGWFLAVCLVSVLGVALYIYWVGIYADFFTALRFSAFNVVSLATTTGLSSTDYSLWPLFAPLWMLFLCSFATSSGSTGGGMKMARALLLVKQTGREIMRSLHPSVVHSVRLGRSVVPYNVLFAVLAFAFVYMASIALLTILLVFTELDLVTASTAIIASINNTGPGLGEVGPASNYESLTDLQTWICCFAMLLGRLEIFTLLVVLTPSFWRR